MRQVITPLGTQERLPTAKVNSLKRRVGRGGVVTPTGNDLGVNTTFDLSM
jgi:hypothetical protein